MDGPIFFGLNPPNSSPASGNATPASSSSLTLPTAAYNGALAIMGVVMVALLVLSVVVRLVFVWCMWRGARRRREQQQLEEAARQEQQGQAGGRRPCAGLELTLLHTLPTTKVGHVVFEEGCQTGQMRECAVCLGEYGAEDVVKGLPGCGHWFHVDCIDTWFKEHATCPICRAEVMVEAEEAAAQKGAAAHLTAPPAQQPVEPVHVLLGEGTGERGAVLLPVDRSLPLYGPPLFTRPLSPDAALPVARQEPAMPLQVGASSSVVVVDEDIATSWAAAGTVVTRPP